MATLTLAPHPYLARVVGTRAHTLIPAIRAHTLIQAVRARTLRRQSNRDVATLTLAPGPLLLPTVKDPETATFNCWQLVNESAWPEVPEHIRNYLDSPRSGTSGHADSLTS